MLTTFSPRVEDFKTTGPRLKVRGGRFKTNLFIQRVIHIWNGLPEDIMEADIIVTFVRYFYRYRYMDREVLMDNGPNASQ